MLSKNYLPSIKLNISIRIFCSLLFISCHQHTGSNPDNKQPAKDTVAAKQTAPEKVLSAIPALTAIPDSGKAHFKVAVYKNNELFAKYEGDWAISLQSGKLMSIQFPASPRMMKIAHGMIMYFNSPAVGTFPIVLSGNEKQKPVVIFTPEVDGAYGIGTSAVSGTVAITKYNATDISGAIDAVGKDVNGNTITIQAAFIHIKNNISD